MLTPEQLSAWRQITDKATDGPWIPELKGNTVQSYSIPGVCHGLKLNGGCDAAFVAAARTAVPALLDEVERLREENAALRADTELGRMVRGMPRYVPSFSLENEVSLTCARCGDKFAWFVMTPNECLADNLNTPDEALRALRGKEENGE